MPRENFGNVSGQTIVDPFFPDGYTSDDQNDHQKNMQRNRYAPTVNSINFKWPLNAHLRGFFDGNTTTIGAVRENIKVLLLTNRGERVMHGNMGPGILASSQSILFEPNLRDEAFEGIRLEIETAIKNYLPYVKVINISVITQEQEPALGDNSIRVSMSYTLTDQSALADSVTVTINNVER